MVRFRELLRALDDEGLDFVVVGGFQCRVLDLDTLIRSKEAANRDKDRLALPWLRAIRDSRDLAGRE